MTCEEILASMVMRGFTVADMDLMTLGMCVNYAKAYDRAELRSKGYEVPDPEHQYRQLKKIQPVVEERYKNGEISESRYKAFMQPILEYEQ